MVSKSVKTSEIKQQSKEVYFECHKILDDLLLKLNEAGVVLDKSKSVVVKL